MYNGIGLRTVRGSGTSGHVQANTSLLKAKAQIRRLAEQKSKATLDAPAIDVRKANPDILEHEMKRKIEIELLRFRDKLEAVGIAEDDIDARVEVERKRLREDPRFTSAALTASKGKTDSHVMAAAKAADDARVRSAFGIAAAHVEGQAFDRELQAKRRDEAKEARETKQREMDEQRRQRDEASRAFREDRARKAEAAHAKTSLAVQGAGSGAITGSDPLHSRRASESKSNRKRSASPAAPRGRKSARSLSRSTSRSSRRSRSSSGSYSRSSHSESSRSRSYRRRSRSRSARSSLSRSRSSTGSRASSASPRPSRDFQRRSSRGDTATQDNTDKPVVASQHDRPDSQKAAKKPTSSSPHAGRKRYRSRSSSYSSSSISSRSRSASASPKRARRR